MKKVMGGIALAVLLTAGGAIADDEKRDAEAPSKKFNPYEGNPNPIAVWIQTDPWAMLIGADPPRMVIYENGQVIFERKQAESTVFRHAQMDEKGLANLKQHVQPVLDLKALKPAYDIAPGVTNQPETKLYLRQDGHEVTTSIYGLMSKGRKLPGTFSSETDEAPDTLPTRLVELHKFLCALDFSDSQEWAPTYVEVVLTGGERAPDPKIASDNAVPWPKDWPALGSGRAFRHSPDPRNEALGVHGDQYSLFIDGSSLPALRKLLDQKHMVEVDGRIWSAEYRLAFPNELMWMKAFWQAEER